MKKMIKKYALLFISFLICAIGTGQEKDSEYSLNENIRIRHLEDTIGFPQYKWQMDSILSRIEIEDKVVTTEISKAVICPHDDYAYASGLYKKTLSSVKAKTILLIGVAHRARNFDLKDKLIFGSFSEWKTAYGNIKISPLRNQLISKIPDSTYIVHNDMMQLEHSLEAITPFLKHDNNNVEIIPILVPYNTFKNMEELSDLLAQSLVDIMEEENMKYGEDLAVVISSDAIHYGNEGWGSSNLAPFGVDSLGTAKAFQKDIEIINSTLTNEITKDKIEDFNRITVKEKNYMEYNWTWCGRYSIPFGLLTANKLSLFLNHKPLSGRLVDYRSSFHNSHIKVDDLQMGTTAPANNTHWVGYTGIKYN